MPRHFQFFDYHVAIDDGTSVPAPLAFAEQLNQNEAWQLNKRSIRPTSTYIDYETAWANVEIGLCAYRFNRRVEALAHAATLFGGIQGRKGRYKTRAGVALDFMPLFEHRAKRETYPPEALASLYGRLGERALALATLEDSRNFGDMYEILFLGICLGLRDTDYLAFPASVREEASSLPTKNYNHDAYIKRGHKIPLQLKSEARNSRKKYQPEVFKINVRKILFQAAVRTYGKERWDASYRTSAFLYVMPEPKCINCSN